ncbi:hypothetical protein GOBAR_AA25974 [Gossypium barbadense]|uniref:Leucine-rich repeat-containing N-terminal plant-type domain-containing protein n=1 Tax=Gossypium barbadense TaxID=3634 RepID=A0A2P5WUD3_GOSBA|nr:hypothetical protein GOBAR_AA25974 [Gossypium barbadense]
MQQPCLDSERSTLLQLKDNFFLNRSASAYTFAYPKDNLVGIAALGMAFNVMKTLVTLLDSSFLYGSIHSNSTLFQLHHLRRLNLSDNDFNGPSAIGNLTRLSQLDLSWSGFTCQIRFQSW